MAGQSISVVGSWMQDAALRWYVQMQTADIGSEFWLGLTAATASLPIVLFSLLGGWAADHFPRRWLIVACQIGLASISLLFGFGVAAITVPLWLVLVFAAANGLILSFDIPARQAFAVEMVGTRDLMNGIALNSAVFNLGRLLGPLAAGWTIFALGVPACFLLNAMSFLGVIIALVAMRVEPAPETETKRANDGLWVGFRTIGQDRNLLGLICCLSIVLLTGSTYVTLLPAFAQYVLKLDAGGYSWLLTASGLGSLLGAMAVAGLDSLEARRPAILAGIVALGFGLVMLGLASRFSAACVALVMAGGGFLLFLAATNSTVQLSVTDDVRGRVMSVWVLVFGICQPIGNAAAGWTASKIGTPATFVWIGLACFVAALMAGVLFFGRTSIDSLAAIPDNALNEPTVVAPPATPHDIRNSH